MTRHIPLSISIGFSAYIYRSALITFIHMQDIYLTFIPIQATVSTLSFYYNLLLKNYHPYAIHIFSKIFSLLFLLLTFFVFSFPTHFPGNFSSAYLIALAFPRVCSTWHWVISDPWQLYEWVMHIPLVVSSFSM